MLSSNTMTSCFPGGTSTSVAVVLVNFIQCPPWETTGKHMGSRLKRIRAASCFHLAECLCVIIKRCKAREGNRRKDMSAKRERIQPEKLHVRKDSDKVLYSQVMVVEVG